MSAPPSASLPRQPGLDGLRAIAILLVLLFHLTPGHNANQGVRSAVFKLAEIGWSGVDLFFVLSGFLITAILLRAKARSLPLRDFLAARVLRIAPAYYLALAIVFVAYPLATGAFVVDPVTQASFWLYVRNFTMNHPSPGGDAPFGLDHFWSLCIEMQFYLLWPVLVYRFARPTLVRIALAAIVLAFAGRTAAVLSGADWPVTYAWTPFRVDALLAGALVAIAYDSGVRLRRRAVAAALVAGLGVMLGCAWFGVGQAVLKGPGNGELRLWLRIVLPVAVAVGYGALLWLSLQPGPLARSLSHRGWRPLARYSYGIYIFHFLLLPFYAWAFGPARLREWVGDGDAPVYLFFALASGVSFLVAMVSYHGFEVHFLRMKHREPAQTGLAPVQRPAP